MVKQLYSYRGPVMVYDKVVIAKWTANTYATSPAQAKNNLKFQARKVLGLARNVPVKLCKDIVKGPLLPSRKST